VPAGFDTTMEAYVDWLMGEIARVGEPVDLVGHDWGSLLVQRVVSLRPDLIRTWACGDGPIDREYVWHDLAQQWQTPEVGETIMASMSGDVLAEGLAAVMPPGDARITASQVDDVMKDCILRLYAPPSAWARNGRTTSRGSRDPRSSCGAATIRTSRPASPNAWPRACTASWSSSKALATGGRSSVLPRRPRR
jgi:pimeloyl-ACP methyl ester carboxylesterase